MPTYPTDPDVEITNFKSLAKGNSCNLTAIKFGTHSGTHVDAPKHIFNDGLGVDSLALQKLIVTCRVIDINKLKEPKIITKEMKEQAILLKNGNLNLSQAQSLLNNKISCVGTNEQSIESGTDKSHPVHKLLLSNDVIIIENLNLEQVSPGVYQLICLPLKIKDCDGAPCRAILVYE